MYYICIPAYNESKNIKELLYKVKKELEMRGHNYHVFIYDDGSTDKTADYIIECSESMPITLIRGEENMGLSHGLGVLVKKVIEVSKDEEEDVAIVLEGDNTQNPGQIFRMIDKINEGFDVVNASRFKKDSRVVGVPAGRIFLSKCAGILMKILFPIKGMNDYTCGYRAYRTSILAKVHKAYGECLFEARDFACMSELIIKLKRINALITEIPILLRYDLKESSSKMKILRNIVSTLKMIVRLKLTTTKPKMPLE